MIKQVLVAAWLSTSFPSFAQGPHEGARDVTGPLNIGNDRAIAEMRQQGRLGTEVVKFVDASSRPDRAAMEDALVACRASGETARDANDAIACALQLAGLNAAKGDAPSWANAWHWLRTSGVHLLTNGTGKGSLGKGFDEIDFASIKASAPTSRFRFASPAGRLDLLPAELHDATPQVMVTIGGKQVRALVDTGASATLIVPRTMVSDFSMKQIAKGLTVLQHALPSIDRSNETKGWDGYALADFTIGNLIGKDVLVLVTDRPLARVVIGNELLSLFGEVTFGDGFLELKQPGHAPLRCTADVPLRFLPGNQFHGKFTIPATINGQSARLALDTGAGPTLTVVGHAARQFADNPRRAFSATVGGMPARVEVGSASVSLTSGSFSARSIQASVVQGERTNVDAILGAPLLIQRRASINFESGYACL
ncbi:aspartyl protease family protein [Pseudoxanthomonas sp. LH2527]|uniref:aspartyl protease family protein n=1 Tax=Pseudoxanthomonas sp. LH2527 TaxID=2923249 RepID=UPI001F138027|nr:aspartyl protease family protein [Pseudoxanthomonas sp. LH2527]MCH6482896.1 aspartyl protease family protein [Pseudoxanthomonas sp. LH2527]